MASFTLDAKIPEGPLEKKWDNHKFNMKLVNPANRRKHNVIVVGTGLAGGAAAALAGMSVPDIFELKANDCEVGNVKTFVTAHPDVAQMVRSKVSTSTLDIDNVDAANLLKA